MDLHDQVPILVLEVLEANVTENTGIVDEDIDSAKGLDGGLDNGLAILDGIVVGHGLAASSLDLVYDNIGGL